MKFNKKIFFQCIQYAEIYVTEDNTNSIYMKIDFQVLGSMLVDENSIRLLLRVSPEMWTKVRSILMHIKHFNYSDFEPQEVKSVIQHLLYTLFKKRGLNDTFPDKIINIAYKTVQLQNDIGIYSNLRNKIIPKTTQSKSPEKDVTLMWDTDSIFLASQLDRDMLHNKFNQTDKPVEKRTQTKVSNAPTIAFQKPTTAIQKSTTAPDKKSSEYRKQLLFREIHKLKISVNNRKVYTTILFKMSYIRMDFDEDSVRLLLGINIQLWNKVRELLIEVKNFQYSDANNDMPENDSILYRALYILFKTRPRYGHRIEQDRFSSAARIIDEGYTTFETPSNNLADALPQHVLDMIAGSSKAK